MTRTTTVTGGRWHRSERNDVLFDGEPTRAWYRVVVGGYLHAYVAHMPTGWHVSVSYVDDESSTPTRLPTWAELFHAREVLVPAGVTMAVVLHAEVSAPTMLHLHEIPWPPEAKS